MNLNELIRQLNRLQQRVDSLIKPEVSRWMDWTPTVTQSGSVTATVTFARYVIIGGTVHLRARLAITGTGTAGNSIVIGGLPSAIAPVNVLGVVGTILVTDAAAAFYVGALVVNSSSSFVGRAHLETSNIGIDPNFALANNDAIDLVGTYEKA